MSEIAKPRLLRAVNPPLGSYFRVGRDHKPLQALLAQDRASFSGLVFDAWAHEHQGELRRAAGGRVETVLDTKSFELSTVRGAADQRLANLAWAGHILPHTPDLLRGARGDTLVARIADEVAERRYSAVLAPAHFLKRADEAWLDVDVNLAQRLRVALNLRQLHDVTLYFPLAIHSNVFASPAARTRILDRLALRAARFDEKLEPTRARLEGWRLTLGAMNTSGPPTTVALAPEGKRTQPHLERSS